MAAEKCPHSYNRWNDENSGNTQPLSPLHCRRNEFKLNEYEEYLFIKGTL